MILRCVCTCKVCVDGGERIRPTAFYFLNVDVIAITHIEAAIMGVDDDSREAQRLCTQQQQRSIVSNTIDAEDGRCRSNNGTMRFKSSKYRPSLQLANQHRLDHTYAAALGNRRIKVRHQADDIETNLTLTGKINDEEGNDEENDQIDVVSIENEIVDVETYEEKKKKKSSSDGLWLKNFCLDYEPVIRRSRGRRRRRQNNNIKDGQADKENLSFYFTRSSGVVKQYRGNRRLSRFGANKSNNAKVARPAVQEDKKRWIAALALIELAQQLS
uniref:Uncharacterized protein n=1 Tax=Trichogramma kaykai TaxID=54128 RepID=A0ABD2X435_9HYME